MTLTQLAAAGVPAFLASLVEFVEALTVVLAVGVTRGWRPALAGTAAGVGALGVLVIVLGPALALVPIDVLRLVVGVLLLLFGMRWLRKAALRAAGSIGLHDEDAIYDARRRELAAGERGSAFDTLGFLTSFKAVVLEGLEVVFIVIAVGAAGRAIVPAGVGAAAAGVLVVAVGAGVRRPLARVPENTLKFAVGVLLTSFGTFWTGEGLGAVWPGADAALPLLVVIYTVGALTGAALTRRLRSAR